MNIRFLFICLSVFCFSCIEPYEFVVEDNEPRLVVEGYISNVSFNESLGFPSDGRYFVVQLRYTSDVTNRKGNVPVNATILLEDKLGQQWAYTESSVEPGKHILMWEDFEAVEGRAYKLKLILANEEIYESDWQKLPPPAPVGEISFEEVEKQVYRIKLREQVIETIKGIKVYVDVPENEAGAPLYYRWSFEPTWIYIAPLARTIQSDDKCWISSKLYLAESVIQKDNRGGYRKELFFMETIRNERIFEKFSLLVVQQSLTEENYHFWKELQEQVKNKGTFETPPFNLQTNIKAVNHDKKASGFFGVLNESASRWYFDKEDLSYDVENTLRADCAVIYGPGGPAESCVSCLEYPKGDATTSKPFWWESM